ncbi:MAG TPA: hypothetical protein ENN07_08020 [candidate division Zixibacteria bacterium]|nr:hypothetical protein [candidate division Zixibacteria bacterium]
MSLDFRNHKVQKIAGGILILAIVGVLWFTQVYSPNQEIIMEKRKELESLNNNLAKAKRDAAKLPLLRKEVERLFIRYKLLEELMPTTRDVADFVDKLNIAARENNMRVRRLDVLPSEPTEYYHTNPYRVSLTGNYHELGAFLESIANLKFVATTKNFMVKKGSGALETISAEFIINAYHIPSEERLQPPSIIGSSSPEEQEGAISKPTAEARPRATEGDAVTALSGGMAPVLD